MEKSTISMAIFNSYVSLPDSSPYTAQWWYFHGFAPDLRQTSRQLLTNAPELGGPNNMIVYVYIYINII